MKEFVAKHHGLNMTFVFLGDANSSEIEVPTELLFQFIFL